MLAPVLLIPVAGLVVDRVRAKALLPPIMLAEGVVAVGLGYFTSEWATVGLVALLGVGVAFSQPGYSAMVPALVGDDNVPRAQGTLQAYQGVAGIAGPAAGGLLVGALGTSWPLYVDALTFAVCAIGTLFVRGDRVPTHVHDASGGGDVLAGVRLLFADAMLRPVTAEVMVFILAIGVVNIASVFLIVRVMDAGSYAYGIFQATYGVGMIVGALLAGRRPPDAASHVRLVFGGLAVLGAAFAVVGVTPTVWWALAPMVIGGVAEGVVNTSAMVIYTLRTPEGLRGRVFAAISAVFTSMQVVSVGLGAGLLPIVSARVLFVAGGCLALLSVLIFGPSAARATRRAIHASA
jgi:MFS family permease